MRDDVERTWEGEVKRYSTSVGRHAACWRKSSLEGV